jgi:hypothetical protein
MRHGAGQLRVSLRFGLREARQCDRRKKASAERLLNCRDHIGSISRRIFGKDRALPFAALNEYVFCLFECPLRIQKRAFG